MNKELLSEILRMKQMMGYDKSVPVNILFEQQPDSFEPEEQQPQEEEEGMGTFERYGKFKLGGKDNKDFPTIMDRPINVIVEPGKVPIVKKFQKGDTSKKFIDNVKEFKQGDKLRDGTDAPVGGEYIEYGGVRYCLPVKEWWDDWNGFIYQFKNGKTFTDFTMRLSLQPYVNVLGATLKGAEASQSCKGGDNGWGFSIASNGMVFYKKDGSGETYGIDKEEVSATSDYDDWWNGYGSMITEFGIAILANIVAPGVGGALVGMAEAMLAVQRAVRLARFILMLSKKSYTLFGRSSAVWLNLITESITETTLMSPIIYNLWKDGKKNEAVLGTIMCFLPFFTNAKLPSKWVNEGLKMGPTDVGFLMRKIQKFGGLETIWKSKEANMKFLSSLDPLSKRVYASAVQIMVRDPLASYKAVNDIIATQGDEIFETLMKKADAVEPGLGKKILEFTNKNLNVFTGKGVIPKFVRGGALVLGAVVLPLKKILDGVFYKKGLTRKQAQELAEKYRVAMENSFYIKNLFEINEKLGLTSTEQLGIDIAEYTFMSDPNGLANLKSSGKIMESFFSKGQVEAAAKKKVTQMENVISERINEIVNNPEIVDKLAILNSLKITKELVETILTNNKQELSEWLTAPPTGDVWTFLTINNENGEVKFAEDRTFDVYINGVKLNKE